MQVLPGLRINSCGDKQFIYSLRHSGIISKDTQMDFFSSL